VFPGGADLPYCRALDGAGNRRIRQYVQGGGLYIGFCAGAYYASGRCEFMVGDPMMEVVGDRELAFYPGVKRGLAYNGFKYQSEEGARAAVMKMEKGAFENEEGLAEESFSVYCNGGGVFVDAPLYKSRGVEILASYTDKLDVDSGQGAAAVVYCKVGDGSALLTGPHPEYVEDSLYLSNHHSSLITAPGSSLQTLIRPATVQSLKRQLKCWRPMTSLGLPS
jgi:biotin--protein ligase